jgi:pantothenate kinase
LLLRAPPWNTLRPHFDFTVMVDVLEQVLRQRLTSCWQSYALPPEEIARKLEEVDRSQRPLREERKRYGRLPNRWWNGGYTGWQSGASN